MVGLLTFDNDAGTKAGTYRNQTLDKKSKFMFLLIFYGLKWRRDRDSNPGRLLHLAGFQDQCIQPLCHLSDGRILTNSESQHKVMLDRMV